MVQASGATLMALYNKRAKRLVTGEGKKASSKAGKGVRSDGKRAKLLDTSEGKKASAEAKKEESVPSDLAKKAIDCASNLGKKARSFGLDCAKKAKGFRFNQGWLTVLVALAIDNALSQLATDWERCNLQVMAAVISMLLVPYLCALLSRRMRN